ncbi:MAG: methyltransferase [Pseudomonadota bacterium]
MPFKITEPPAEAPTTSRPGETGETPAAFDPARGRQSPWTGILGAGLLLLYFFAYVLFRDSAGAAGEARVDFFISWLPRFFHVGSLPREIFDLPALALTGFLFMASWEACSSPGARGLLLALSFFLAATTFFTPPAGESFFSGSFLFLPGGLSVFEKTTALHLVVLLLFLLVQLAQGARSGALRVRIRLGLALRTSFIRWAAGLAVLFAAALFFTNHPLFYGENFLPWRSTVVFLFLGYGLAGWPYSFLTNLFRSGPGEDRRDFGLIIFLFFRNLLLFFPKKTRPRLGRVLRDRTARILLRDLAVKFFFLPLMITFMFQEYRALSHNLPFLFQAPSFWEAANLNRLYWTIFHSIFVLDVTLSGIGYACSCRWLGNKSRSVEPTLAGWVAALVCYPPFNQAMGQYLPYQHRFGNTPYLDFASWSWLPDQVGTWLNYGLGVGLAGFTLACYLVFVWATMSFGLRFSNLTNRGVITRGPYAFARHPAYAAKNLAWWAESIRGFSSPWQFLFLFGWNLIYYWRAETEERHLQSDPAYRLYRARVKYKFLPGLW